MSSKRKPRASMLARKRGKLASNPLSSRMWPAGVVIRKIAISLLPTKWMLSMTVKGGKSRFQSRIRRGTPAWLAQPAPPMTTASSAAAATARVIARPAPSRCAGFISDAVYRRQTPRALATDIFLV